MGDLAKNFSRSEFLCHHCGACPPVDQVLIDVLQRVRTAAGLPLRIVSGYRCDVHNRAVGGSRTSQHLRARAADVPGGYASIRTWQDAGATGIGVRGVRVVHVDTRRDVGVVVFND